MRRTETIVIGLALLTATCRTADACQRMSPLPSPDTLVHRATAIILATATPNTLPEAVEFQVAETLKGTAPGPLIVFKGRLTSDDDFNDSPFPYSFVRRAGRTGACFAYTYRVGASYLLLLRPTDGRSQTTLGPFTATLTPYWEPLAPTNEQVHGLADRWVQWVRQRVGR